MPNWCANTLRVDGENARAFYEACFDYKPLYKEDRPNELTASLQDIVEARGEKDFTFHALAPVPQEVLDNGFSSAFGQLSGKMDGFTWQTHYWGTKWDVGSGDLNVNDVEDDSVTLCFDTAWSPPTDWLRSAVKQFPHLKFELEFYEPGVCYAGRLIIEGDKEDFIEMNDEDEGYQAFVAEDLGQGWEEFEERREDDEEEGELAQV